MKLTPVKVTADNVAILGEIHSRAWRDAYKDLVDPAFLATFTPQNRTKEFRNLLKTSPCDYFLFYVNDTAVGMGVFGPPDNKTLPKDTGEIHALYLLPSYKGRGLGSQAFAFGLAHLKALGYKKAILWVFEENKNARNFYEKKGFVFNKNSRQPVAPGVEIFEVRYEKEL